MTSKYALLGVAPRRGLRVSSNSVAYPMVNVPLGAPAAPALTPVESATSISNERRIRRQAVSDMDDYVVTPRANVKRLGARDGWHFDCGILSDSRKETA